MTTEDGNGRVTLAVVQRDVQHLADTVQRYHDDLCREMRERDQDHEERIRSLEGASRQGIWRDVGAFLAALGAGIVGVLSNEP